VRRWRNLGDPLDGADVVLLGLFSAKGQRRRPRRARVIGHDGAGFFLAAPFRLPE
jgi:hypothetical protein